MTADLQALLRDLDTRIAEYLSLGGLFNPELMDHEKTRDLLIDARNLLRKAGRDGDTN